MAVFEFHSRTQIVFGPGARRQLGGLARQLGFRRAMLVADAGMVAAGYVSEATTLLEAAGTAVVPYHDFDANPDTEMVERGRALAAAESIDALIGLGGGSSLDCAKGINFVLTNGGCMQDYHGWANAARPLLPMIGVPTTTGTGSEAQSYALISDAATHTKMACGDPKAAFRVAILDPELALTQPHAVRAAAGYDAISHAVETMVTARRNALSECLSREAWRLLSRRFSRFMTAAEDLEAVADMQYGAYLAGLAIENSMLGATHALANPLTQRYGTTHGIAIALLLAPVVRWNHATAAGLYEQLSADLPAELDDLAHTARLPRRLRDAGIAQDDLPRLSFAAAQQWTGRFNPRPFDAAAAMEIYQCVY